MTEYSVKSIVRSDLPTLTPATPIRRAAALLVDAKAAAMAIVGDDGRLMGILSQKDCFRPALHAIYHHDWTGTVEEHMTRDVISVDIDEEVTRAAKMFLDHPHRVFPVLSGQSVAGMLHRSDVLSFLMKFG